MIKRFTKITIFFLLTVAAFSDVNSCKKLTTKEELIKCIAKSNNSLHEKIERQANKLNNRLYDLDKELFIDVHTTWEKWFALQKNDIRLEESLRKAIMEQGLKEESYLNIDLKVLHKIIANPELRYQHFLCKDTEDKTLCGMLEYCNYRFTYVVQMFRSSSFPFNEWHVKPKRINLVLDHHNEEELTARARINLKPGEGTGTVGWMGYNFKTENLYQIKITDPNAGKHIALSYNKNWAEVIKTISSPQEKKYLQVKKKTYLYESPNNDSKSKKFLIKDDIALVLKRHKNWYKIYFFHTTYGTSTFMWIEAKDVKVLSALDTYDNNRFGFSIDYPTKLFVKKEYPQNADGVWLKNRDETVLLSPSASYVVDDNDNIKSIYQNHLTWRKEKKEIELTYKVQKENWFVLSGYNHKKKSIFYEKHFLYKDDDGFKILVGYTYEYPIAKKHQYNKFIKVFNDSFIYGE